MSKFLSVVSTSALIFSLTAHTVQAMENDELVERELQKIQRRRGEVPSQPKSTEPIKASRPLPIVPFERMMHDSDLSPQILQHIMILGPIGSWNPNYLEAKHNHAYKGKDGSELRPNKQLRLVSNGIRGVVDSYTTTFGMAASFRYVGQRCQQALSDYLKGLKNLSELTFAFFREPCVLSTIPALPETLTSLTLRDESENILNEELKKFTALTYLDLAYNQVITDEALEGLVELKGVCVSWNTKITIDELKKLPKLENVNFQFTELRDNELNQYKEDLKKELPHIKINGLLHLL